MTTYITDFSNFTAYFRDLSARSTYLKYFEQGGSEKIVSERLVTSTRSRLSYPLLFLEWPEIPLLNYGSANTMISFNAAFAILDEAGEDDWMRQDAIMTETLTAVLQILIRMKSDSEGLNKKFLYFDLSRVVIQPLDNLLIDSCYGWRAEFVVSAPFSTCPDPAFWQE